MPTLVLDPQPAAIEQLLQQRARLDLDRRDEVWEGVLHMIPPPSHEHERLAVKLVGVLDPLADAAGLELTGTVGIGEGKDDYRVPDLALHRPGYAPQWHPTAALVVEIVSPGDKSWDKLRLLRRAPRRRAADRRPGQAQGRLARPRRRHVPADH